MARPSPLLCALAACGACAFHSLNAQAAPPGDFSVAVERLFGIVRTTYDYGDVEDTSTSISLFSQVSGHAGYSAPRLAFDWLSLGGISFGGAIGYQTDGDDGNDGDAWLLVARVGYFARPSSGFGIWPRVGITHIAADYGIESDATALTFEVPLEFLMSRGIAISITPHVDLGISGNQGDVDRDITEIGLQFGAGAFF
ncbi:MAG TPA: hypothetical protein VMG12_38530 [Polyangiaceae bacterium]|nr:hypothetical protein [Polyangiaceae bacterium]